MTPLIYLAHPVGGDASGNADKARTWLRVLIGLVPEVNWICPWIPSVDVLDDTDEAHREWAMRVNLATVRRCDGIVLCGGRVSNGMRDELNECTDGRAAIVIDLTGLSVYSGSEIRFEVLRSIGAFTLDGMK